jgi:uncharacterized damage-inducible protein DinB
MEASSRENVSTLLTFTWQRKDFLIMSAVALFRSLFHYQSWANAALLAALESLHPDLQQEAQHSARRLINHNYVVGQIFAAHLVGARHSYTADNTTDIPALEDLRLAVSASDRWYLGYLESVTPAQLSENVPFVFTDGDRGYMSREEMLAHVVTHGIYHRGEVGRILAQLSITPPWDTFAVFLHGTEPARRLQTPDFQAISA